MKLKKNISNALLISSIGFISILIYQYYPDIIIKLPAINTAGIITASLIIIAQSIFTGFIFASTLPETAEYSKKDITLIFLTSQLSKYIPGKIWSFAQQKLMLGKEFTIRQLLISNSLLGALQFVMLILSGLTCFLFIKPPPFFIISILIAALISTTAINLKKTHKIEKYLSPQIKSILGTKSNFRMNIGLLITYSLSFSTSFIISHYILAQSTLHTTPETSISIVMISAFAWLIGAASIIFPSGIGIKEYSIITLGALSEQSLNTSDLVFFALVLRSWGICTDLLTGLVSSILLKAKDLKDPSL